jgi:hypothetical protein
MINSSGGADSASGTRPLGWPPVRPPDATAARGGARREVTTGRKYVKSRRLATAGLGLVAAVTFAVAGCGGTTNSPATNNQPAAGQQAQDPAAALAAAAAKLAEESFKMTMKMGDTGTMTGAMDPKKKLGRTSMTVSTEGVNMKVETLMVGADLYMKMDMGGLALPGIDPKKWMHLDTAKLPANSSLGIRPGETDPASAEKLLKAATKVEKVGDRGFKGTLDLTKLNGVAGIEDKDVTSLGDKAKAVPFTASTDDQGRLTNMKVDMPIMSGVDLGSLDATYSDFGTTVEVTKPDPSKVTEAPEALYGTLGA